ncbi:MAG: DUF1304 family protein [Gemmatimonas sp.]
MAIIHIYVLVLEMFLWTKPARLRVFGHTQAAANASSVLAAEVRLNCGGRPRTAESCRNAEHH